MKRPLIGRKDFPQLPLDKENKFKERSWETLGWGKSFYFVFLEEEMNECLKGKLICYVNNYYSWEQMVCKQKNMEESYV
jgi:hypothetical protein